MFIAFDWCGWREQLGRFTHMPSCDTLVQQGWYDQAEWDKAQLEWFSKYPGLTVHDCSRPGAYTTDGRSMGTTDEIVKKLEKRLNLAVPKGT